MSDTDSRSDTTLPPQVTMSLLDYLTTHALDQDYAAVADRRAAPPMTSPPTTSQATTSQASRGRSGWVAAGVLAVFAVLVVTAGVQTTRQAGSDDAQRHALITQVEAARNQLDNTREEGQSLKADNAGLRRELLSGADLAAGQASLLRTLGSTDGTVPVRGPGVRVVVDDAPGSTSDRTKVLDVDLQRLINGLWGAGAEAIAINGQRLTNLSSIRHAGDAITVNFRSLKRPYTVQVIGDPATLPARFADTSSGQAWLSLHQQLGLHLEMARRESMTLPAAADPTLRIARTPSPGAERKATK